MKTKEEIISLINSLPDTVSFVIEKEEYRTVENLDCELDRDSHIWNTIFEEGGDIERIMFPGEYLDKVEGEDLDPYEDLGYWTVYYKPEVEDLSVCMCVGLVPFTFDDEFYLALGGCGMDLSPKLDAYVALTRGVIPKNSKFFSDPNYFKYVTGEKVLEKVVEAITLEKPRYIIRFETDVDVYTERAVLM